MFISVDFWKCDCESSLIIDFRLCKQNHLLFIYKLFSSVHLFWFTFYSQLCATTKWVIPFFVHSCYRFFNSRLFLYHSSTGQKFSSLWLRIISHYCNFLRIILLWISADIISRLIRSLCTYFSNLCFINLSILLLISFLFLLKVIL